MTDIDWEKWLAKDELNQERYWKIVQSSSDEVDSEESDQ